MSSTPWMPLYIGDYLAGTAHLSTEQHGAYLLLLMHHWRNGPLPDDDIQLAQIARIKSITFVRRHAQILRAFFEKSADGLIHTRLMKERAHADDVSAKRAASGKLGGRPNKPNPGSNSYPNGDANNKQKETERGVHSHSQSESKSFLDLEEGKEAARDPEPTEAEATPTDAEITERRQAHHQAVAALPPAMAEAVAALGRSMRHVEYAQGQRPQFDRHTQIALANHKSPRPFHLAADQLRAARAAAGVPIAANA